MNKTQQEFYEGFIGAHTKRPIDLGTLVAGHTRPPQFYLELVRRSLTLEAQISDFARETFSDINGAPFEVPAQAIPFILVPTINERLQGQYGVGTISGRKSDGSLTVLGLIADKQNIIAYDVKADGEINLYKANTPDELRAKLTQAYGGQWWDCIFAAPRLNPEPTATQADDLVLGDVPPASRPYVLELVRRSARRFPVKILGAQTPAAEYVAEHKKLILRLLREGTRAPVPVNDSPAPLEATGDDENWKEQPANETREADADISLARGGRKVTVTEDGVSISRPDREVSITNDGVVITAIPNDKDGSLEKAVAEIERTAPVEVPVPPAAPTPEPRPMGSLDARRDYAPETPMPARPAPTLPAAQYSAPPVPPVPAPVLRFTKEDGRVIEVGGPVNRSEIDSDLLEELIHAETVHIGTLNVHIHKGAKLDEEE